MRLCAAIEKAWFGRRELWLRCGYVYGHPGPHHDRKHISHYWAETFRAFEFEYGRPRKVPTKRKGRICGKCGKQQRTDGANDACVCKEIGANRRQKVMFLDEREQIERTENARQLAEDIAWIQAEHARMDENGYHGEF